MPEGSRGTSRGFVALLAACALLVSVGAGIAMAFDENRAIGAVAAARLDSDLVVVMPHWGMEGQSCPTQDQQSFARKLALAGADIIVGAHAHVLQGSTTVVSESGRPLPLTGWRAAPARRNYEELRSCAG
jgi:hypothetical protein